MHISKNIIELIKNEGNVRKLDTASIKGNDCHKEVIKNQVFYQTS